MYKYVARCLSRKEKNKRNRGTQEVYGIRFFEDMNKIEEFIANTFHLVRVYNASVFDQM